MMMAYQCEVNEQPAQPVVSLRTRVAVQDLPQVLGDSYGALMRHLIGLGEFPCGAPFVAYYNMDMQDLDIEIGFPVKHALPGNGEIRAGSIPAGKYAATVYTGPYPDIAPAYEALSAWIRRNGVEPTGVAYEFYLNDPQSTPPPELQTQICLPVK